MDIKTPGQRHWQIILFALFSLSGFAGLIYESIWSHYLKLFLGHAAYAQTLVLAIFMGGMALGAWLCGKLIHRLKNPLLGYVIVELVIGALGLLFHPVFTSSTGFLLDNILPGMDSPMAIELVRWSFAALLILPQTLLLGATFPLMSVGILRNFPAMPGSSIALLYFSNSLGAVIGVLASGFWLISAVGLPGTIMAAALINFLLAFGVYAIGKQVHAHSVPSIPATSTPDELLRPLLLVALVTGLSSFVYEIGWIRMLSLVLGASTHAFELMLAAFILGLALGGLWVRKHIDRYDNPLQALGIVQLLMGLLALGTIVSYNHIFDIMQGMMNTLQRNESGYLWFNLGSHLIAALVMLPVTFMAGMTLPLITYMLFSRGSGESAIGKVYAANTLGAIIGVWLTVQWLLPLTGLKHTILIGAALDLALGIYLLARSQSGIKLQRMAIVVSGITVVSVGLGVTFDSNRMASGVFRHGMFQTMDILFHKDGHTATVDVYEVKEKRVISTNGKPDAAATMSDSSVPSSDEPTMTLLGSLPLLLNPQLQTAAVIGMGSGISANVLLSSSTLESMDLIEIEEAMVEGAKLFEQHSHRVYNDPRSHIHIDDAKSFFASRHKKYGAIISEPSNPWVSGVANLFTEEFYARIGHYLNDDGYLVQWFQLYETNPAIISSIMKALGPHFEDYRLYAAMDADIVLIARKHGKIPPLDPRAFANPALRKHLERVQWFNTNDIALHEIGDRQLLEPYFLATNSPANSDFFPYVDQHAVKARFMQQDFRQLSLMRGNGLPLPGSNFMGTLSPSVQATPIAFGIRRDAQLAQEVIQYYASSTAALPINLPPELLHAILVTNKTPDCQIPASQALWRHNVATLMAGTLPHVSAQGAAPMLNVLSGQLCPQATASHAMLQVYRALADRNMPAVVSAAQAYFKLGPFPNDFAQKHVSHAYLLALGLTGQHVQALQMIEQLEPQPTPVMALMAAHAKVAIYQQRMQQR